MSNDEVIRMVIVQLPNFLGLVIAVYVLREQNQKLIELLRDCYSDNEAVIDK